MDLELHFHGLLPVPSAVCVPAAGKGGGHARVDVHAGVRAERLAPSAKLTSWERAVRPKPPGEVRPLPEGPRDALPDGRPAYELVLTYPFAQDGDKPVKYTVHSALNGLLYDAQFESQLFMVPVKKKSAEHFLLPC